ncbi:M10 family metallopeptidase C-terminal domain-containing protein [Tsuneonella mangrovi]|uniref:M10 family metallopeptidase C-terminal domain-containing protein n=1 Tax=Tsuneonella mangrovi TaxID=1982042 RepID=UPI000BA25C27|nr:M10 family metallopeptidase C-terminal domain-containing protein [Tsuneonella mangrovi]
MAKIESTSSQPIAEARGDDTLRTQAHEGKLAPVALDMPAPVAPTDFSLDPYAGGTWDGKPILGLDGVVEHIDSGRVLDAPSGTITYSFTDLSHLTGLYNNPNYGFGAPYGFSPFDDAQRDAARASIQLWDDLIPQTFVEKNGIGADIQFGNSWDPAQAYAYYPINGRGWQFQSDVFVADPAVNWTNAWLGFGGYGATTLVHELGHTLGLSHPGNYNYDPDLPLNYANYAEYAQDSEQYTIMSYWGSENTSFNQYNVDWSSGFYNNPQTPLVHDILTIQAKYGADPTTRADDTIYGWNSTAGNAVYDFSQNLFPYLSIYDAGGNDTIDMSGAGVSVYINLHEGAFSSGAAAIPDASVINEHRAAIREAGYTTLGDVYDTTPAYWASTFMPYYESVNQADTYYATGVSISGLYTTAVDNISIAYGTIIENAIGSTQRDYLVGNQVDNVLNGMGGDDVLDGYEGADTLIGGDGADTFLFHNMEMGDTIADFASGEDTIDLTALGFGAFIGNAVFSNSAGEVRFDGGYLSGDIDGDGVADFSVHVIGDAVMAADLVL